MPLLSRRSKTHGPLAVNGSTPIAKTGQVPEPIASTSSSHPPGKDADKEQASVTTTPTTLHTQTRHKSDPAQSSAPVPSTRSKPSFFARLLQSVVPCTGPTRPPSLAHGSSKSEANSVAATELPPGADIVQQAPAVLIIAQPAPPAPPQTELEVIVDPPPSAHTLPDSETDGLTSGAVQPPGSTGGETARIHTHESDDTNLTDDADAEDDEERLIRKGGAGIPIGADGVPMPLLPPISPQHAGRKCLVLDLDETLVHSSFKAVQQADFIVPVEIEYHWHHFHVLKRPGVDNFLKEMGEIYEVVVYTASLSKYADPVLDKLDIHHAVTHRLFRESCYSHRGNYVKDLSQLGRPIADTIILDNSPASYIFHPKNAVPVSSWFNDPHDTELVDLVPFLADLTSVDDVRGILDGKI